MKKLISAILFLFSFSAYAFTLPEVEVSAGVTHANPQDCGIWYMCGQQYPHNLDLNSPAFSFGFTGDLPYKHSGWRAGVEYLGKFSANGIVGPMPDSTFNCPTSNCPQTHFSGDGKVWGLYAEYIYHIGKWRLEGGPTLYRASWTERVPDYVYTADNKGTPPWYHYPDNISSAKWSPGLEAGVGYDFNKHLSAVLSVHMAEDRGVNTGMGGPSDLPSIVKQYVTNISIRYSFKAF